MSTAGWIITLPSWRGTRPVAKAQVSMVVPFTEAYR